MALLSSCYCHCPPLSLPSWWRVCASKIRFGCKPLPASSCPSRVWSGPDTTFLSLRSGARTPIPCSPLPCASASLHPSSMHPLILHLISLRPISPHPHCLCSSPQFCPGVSTTPALDRMSQEAGWSVTPAGSGCRTRCGRRVVVCTEPRGSEGSFLVCHLEGVPLPRTGALASLELLWPGPWAPEAERIWFRGWGGAYSDAGSPSVAPQPPWNSGVPCPSTPALLARAVTFMGPQENGQRDNQAERR